MRDLDQAFNSRDPSRADDEWWSWQVVDAVGALGLSWIAGVTGCGYLADYPEEGTRLDAMHLRLNTEQIGADVHLDELVAGELNQRLEHAQTWRGDTVCMKPVPALADLPEALQAVDEAVRPRSAERARATRLAESEALLAADTALQVALAEQHAGRDTKR